MMRRYQHHLFGAASVFLATMIGQGAKAQQPNVPMCTAPEVEQQVADAMDEQYQELVQAGGAGPAVGTHVSAVQLLGITPINVVQGLHNAIVGCEAASMSGQVTENGVLVRNMLMRHFRFERAFDPRGQPTTRVIGSLR